MATPLSQDSVVADSMICNPRQGMQDPEISEKVEPSYKRSYCIQLYRSLSPLYKWCLSEKAPRLVYKQLVDSMSDSSHTRPVPNPGISPVRRNLPTRRRSVHLRGWIGFQFQNILQILVLVVVHEEDRRPCILCSPLLGLSRGSPGLLRLL